MSCNVIKQYVDFSSKNINKYYKMILKKYYKADIVEEFVSKYIETRYYNLDTNDSGLRNKLKEVYNSLDKDDKKIGEIILYILKYIYYFDDVSTCDNIKNIISELDTYRKNQLQLEDDFSSEFLELYKENQRRKSVYLKSIECDDFPIILKKVKEDNIYDIEIVNKLKIPKLYSDYAIDKTFNTGIISEDKLFIEYYLVSSKILNSIIYRKYNFHYLVEFDTNLFLKEEKINRLLNIINNDIAKDIISLKVGYKDFIENKENIYQLMRDGYKFSVIIDDEYDLDILDVFEYIIVNNENVKIQKSNLITIK